MNCPNDSCENYLDSRERMIMDYVKIHDCFVCPICFGEWWPHIERTGEITSQDVMEVYRDEFRRQNAMRKKSSTRKAGRKARDKKVTITAWWARE